MNEILAQTSFISQNIIIVSAIIFLRVGALMAVLPAFGEKSVPQRVRLALAIGFAMIIGPVVSPQLLPFVDDPSFIGMALVSEVIAGLALGIIIRAFAMTLEIAGTIIAQATSLSQMFGGGGIEPQPVVGHILLVGGLALASMFGLHVRISEVLIYSYDFIPPGILTGAADLSDWGLAHIRTAFSLAFSLSAPFVIASLVYNVALGVINRAMPQLSVAMVGAPAITLGGMILMFISLPFLLDIWQAGFKSLLVNPFEIP